jgi:NAD(P)-dependent dehydrogenase (short-subunit alcohol dehydrogenase family)
MPITSTAAAPIARRPPLNPVAARASTAAITADQVAEPAQDRAFAFAPPAGLRCRGSVVDESEENWRRVMQVNVETMFLTSKHAIPAMRKAGGGAIVNVSSISAIRPRGLTTYTVSKSAVIGLTKAMAVDHGKEGIRVNCVAPGPVYTPMVYSRGMTPTARETRKNASALRIEGTGWDIGAAVRFLLSDQARYITGQVLVVDGGTSLTAPERDSG